MTEKGMTTGDSEYASVHFRAEQEETEIDLIDLGYALLDKLHYIILCFLAGAVLLNAYAYFFVEPTYESTSKLYVVSASDDSVVDLTDLNIGTSLTKDYEELMMSYPVLEQVIFRLKLAMTSEELEKKIELVNPSNTRILNITVTDTDPERAKDIANAISEVACEYLPETMGTLAPNIAQKAKLADRRAAPSYMKYTLIGAVLGTVLCCVWIIFEYLMDDTIHSAEDLEKYFGLVALTTIPNSSQFAQYDEKPKERKGLRRRMK